MRTFPIKLLLYATCMTGLSFAAQAVPVTCDDYRISYYTSHVGYSGESFTAPRDILDTRTFYVHNLVATPRAKNAYLYTWDPPSGWSLWSDHRFAAHNDGDPAWRGNGWADISCDVWSLFDSRCSHIATTGTCDSSGVQSVPDSGSTMMLLGIACLGLCLVGKLASSRMAQAS